MCSRLRLLRCRWCFAGAEKAAAELKAFGVTTLIKTYPTIDKAAEMLAVDEFLEAGCQAIALTPVTEPDVVDRINGLSESGIPVVVFNGDLPDSRRLCYVGMDNYVGGSDRRRYDGIYVFGWG